MVGITCDDDSIVCQNSWGSDRDPIFSVTSAAFVKAYVIDPRLTFKEIPAGARVVAAPLPREQSMWHNAIRSSSIQ